MVDHPGELSDTLEHYIFARHMQNGHMYMGRNHVGQFKMEEDVVYYKGVLKDDDWIVCEPHPDTLFRPNGYVDNDDEGREARLLNEKLQYVVKQIQDGYIEGYYPHWKLTKTSTGWDIRL